jgi:integrase
VRQNDEARTVYLDDELKGLIRHQWEMRKQCGKLTPYVFLSRTKSGKIVNLGKAWNIACRKAGGIP